MSEYARNLDTYGDGDEPEYIPVVGDRVLLDIQDEDPGIKTQEGEQIGVITAIEPWRDGEVRYIVLLDKRTRDSAQWSLRVSLDEIDTVYS